MTVLFILVLIGVFHFIVGYVTPFDIYIYIHIQRSVIHINEVGAGTILLSRRSGDAQQF